MTSRFVELAVDCHDPHGLATFWCQVLGYQIVDEEPDLVEIAPWEITAEALRAAPQPPTVFFARVPEDKVVKNRLHLDLKPIDASRDEEVARLIALGARRVDIGQGDVSWAVLADPEGNEFCVLSPPAPQPQPQPGS